MTYNVHGGIGSDQKLDLSRIADVIANQQPDVVALQELDVGRTRSGKQHQAQIIAEKLGMNFLFHPAFLLQDDEQYGDAILSAKPMQLQRVGVLPTLISTKFREPRGALWVEITLDSSKDECAAKLQIINTHLGLARRERHLQALELIGEQWVSHRDCKTPVILCGDFNSLPHGRVYRLLTQKFKDAQRALPKHRPRATFPSRYPLLMLDYLFLSEQIEVKRITVANDSLSKKASDHLPLTADLTIQT